MNEPAASAREPLFKAPWPAVAIPLALLAAYAWQYWLASDAQVARLALSPSGIEAGRFETLVTYLFVHGSWGHVAMNAAAALAFGPPVARYLGSRTRDVLLFFAFFLLCGVISGLGYVLAHWGGHDLAVGASGAISGFWGGASRLLVGRGRLAAIRNRMVISQGLVFIVINVAVGLLGGLAALNIAWEAHVVGYLAGLTLIGPFGRLAVR